MIRVTLLATIAMTLAGCIKSDADKCVDAQMEAWDIRNADAPPESRISYRAHAYQICQKG